MGAYAPARVFTTSPPSLKQQCWDIVQVSNFITTFIFFLFVFLIELNLI